MRIGDTLTAWRFEARDRTAQGEAMIFSAPDPASSSQAGFSAVSGAWPLDAGGAPGRRLAGTLSGLGLSEAARAEAAQASGRAAEETFGAWARMSPAERVRALVLERHGLSEDGLAALPQDEREAVETAIREAIEERFGLDTAEAGQGAGAEEPAPAA